MRKRLDPRLLGRLGALIIFVPSFNLIPKDFNEMELHMKPPKHMKYKNGSSIGFLSTDSHKAPLSGGRRAHVVLVEQRLHCAADHLQSKGEFFYGDVLAVNV